MANNTHKLLTPVIQTIKFTKDYAIPLVAVILTLLNVYIAGKLNPLLASIKDIVHQVEAIEVKYNTLEKRQFEMKDDLTELKTDIKDDLNYLRTRLDSIFDLRR